MGRHQQVRRSALVGMGLLVLTLSTGCSTCKDWFDPYRDGEPPTGHVTSVMGWWEKSLYGAHDTVNGGALVPGYAGRVYLQDSATQQDVVGHGKVSVYCYDDSAPLQTGKLPTPVEYWNFDEQTLKKLLRKDQIGYGYSLFLPTEHPLSKVYFLVVYQEDKGPPIYSHEQEVTLDPVQNYNSYARTYVPGQPTLAANQQAPAPVQTVGYSPPGSTPNPNPVPSGVQSTAGYGQPIQLTPNLAAIPQNQTSALQTVPAQGGLPTAVQYGPLTSQSSTRYVIVPGTPGQPTAQVGPR